MSSGLVLDSAMAQKFIDGAITKAEEMGIRVSVAVVDAGGHVKQLFRMDGAGWFSAEIAAGKAQAATAFGQDTEEMLRRLEGLEGFATALTSLSHGKLVLVLGGCRVLGQDGELIGAIGVSGARGEDDAVCAQAGLDNLERAQG